MTWNLPDQLPHLLMAQPKMVEKIWGGQHLHRLYNKGDSQRSWGESWEVADLQEGQSDIVYQGSSAPLNAYLQKFNRQITGASFERFPLLLKFIHAAHDLSIQVHPGQNNLSIVPGAASKDECWLILDAEPEAFILHGLKDSQLTQQQLTMALTAGDITPYLRQVPVSAGDVISIPPGTAHAICGGIVLLELQEPSDTTYRLWDYNRPGLDGKPRPLHQEQGLQVIQYGEQPPTKIIPKFIQAPDHHLLLERPQFRMEKAHLLAKQTSHFIFTQKQAHLLICLSGNGQVTHDTQTETLLPGQTIIVPAQTSSIEVVATQEMNLVFSGSVGAPLVHRS